MTAARRFLTPDMSRLSGSDAFVAYIVRNFSLAFLAFGIALVALHLLAGVPAAAVGEPPFGLDTPRAWGTSFLTY